MPDKKKTVEVLYFASLREAVGHHKERLLLPCSVVSVEDLRLFLQEKHPSVSLKKESIHVAVDQHLVGESHTLCDGQEVAFFPDVTGG